MSARIATEAIQEIGGCGALSEDEKFACIMLLGHNGPHGWESSWWGTWIPTDDPGIPLANNQGRMIDKHAVGIDDLRDAIHDGVFMDDVDRYTAAFDKLIEKHDDMHRALVMVQQSYRPYREDLVRLALEAVDAVLGGSV